MPHDRLPCSSVNTEMQVSTRWRERPGDPPPSLSILPRAGGRASAQFTADRRDRAHQLRQEKDPPIYARPAIETLGPLKQMNH